VKTDPRRKRSAAALDALFGRRFDDIAGHAFAHGYHPDHTARLAAYWAEALGGPAAYSGALGDETAVVRMHSGNGDHAEMDRRAIACFGVVSR